MLTNKFSIIFYPFFRKINRIYSNSTYGCKKTGYNFPFSLYNENVVSERRKPFLRREIMNKCGKRISELRKKHGLTQLELGNKLSVTAQAVSKWENGASEPDIETLKRISVLFGVSVDELLSDEIAATTSATKTEETSKREIVAECEKCGKPVAAGEYGLITINHVERRGRSTHSYSTQHIYCNDCCKKHKEEERLKEIAIRKEKARGEYAFYKSAFLRGTIWGLLAAIAVAIGFIIASSYVEALTPVVTIIAAAISCYGIFALVFQCFFDGYVLEVLEFFSRSFQMPMLIFSLDLDSIAIMLLLKITLPILLGILSAMIFAVGVVVAAFLSLFTFPFALAKNVSAKREAKEELEASLLLK